MGKSKKVISILLLGLSSTALLAGCSRENANEEIDETKSQLYVSNYNGGFGSEWLTSAKEKFEELHKNDSFETGRTGVQIIVTNHKSTTNSFTPSQIKSSRDEIYFNNDSNYRSMVTEDSALADITKYVTEKNSSDNNKSIEDKMTSEQKNFWGVKGSDNTVHYYGIPHYHASYGISYNVDLFEENGLYFKENHETETKLDRHFTADLTKRNAGPDGKANTYDDGLPSTYDELFLLCDYMVQLSITPFIWNGQYSSTYMNWFLNALMMAHQGYEQSKLLFTCDGEVQNRVEVTNNEITSQLGSISITPSTGYELYKQDGKFYALSFLRKILDTNEYRANKVFNGSYSTLNAQNDFLKGGIYNSEKVGMILEGAWWENEANSTFEEIATNKGQNYARNKRKFAFMPLPKATKEAADAAKNRADGKSVTLFDSISSIAFIKSNISEAKLDLAGKFLQFVNTDEMLQDFSTITNNVKAFNYEIDEEHRAKMSYFGRSLLDVKANANVIYHGSDSSIYVNNQSFFNYTNLWNASINNNEYQYPYLCFRNNADVTAGDYFNAMGTYFQKNWPTNF